MKRVGYLYDDIISINNLILADNNARKGKKDQISIKRHDLNKENNILKLHDVLKNNLYKTSNYKVFTIYEPKERVIYRLPYYPDRIVHHAIMNIIRPVFIKNFTHDTYSCIKGRGIHLAVKKMKQSLRDNTMIYCLKIDIHKFFPSINHDILKKLLSKKFKDKRLLNIIFEIIDSCKEGIPIGNYLSQYLANFYLSYFDHWIKEENRVKYYFRYADDMVFLSSNKQELHILLEKIKNYIDLNLKLKLKKNWQIFPIDKRGIDFVGYKFYRTHTLVRKRIKNQYFKKLKKGANNNSISSYKGWFKHADCKNLLKKKK